MANPISFHDRNDLSEEEGDMEAEASSQTYPAEAPVPVSDTGPKQIQILGRETRSLKRASVKASLGDTNPKGKRTRPTKDDDISHLTNLVEKLTDTVQELLKEMRNQNATINDLKNTVTNKMTMMDTKISVQQDRISSLQTARRDGFLNTLTLDTTQTAPLPGVPHYVAQPASSRQPVSPTSQTLGPSFLEQFGM